MPGVTAGPGFELFYQVDYLLPHREAAWVLMEERLRDAAAFAVRCGQACTPALMEPLARAARALEKYADQLLAAQSGRGMRHEPKGGAARPDDGDRDP